MIDEDQKEIQDQAWKTQFKLVLALTAQVASNVSGSDEDGQEIKGRSICMSVEEAR